MNALSGVGYLVSSIHLLGVGLYIVLALVKTLEVLA